MRPFVGWMKPASVRKAVVFPHPEGPSRVKNSPSSIVSSKSGSATKSPKATSTSS